MANSKRRATIATASSSSARFAASLAVAWLCSARPAVAQTSAVVLQLQTVAFVFPAAPPAPKPVPVDPTLQGLWTSVLVHYFEQIAGPLRPLAGGGWSEDPAATVEAMQRAGQDEARAGRAPRTVDEAVELQRKREMGAALGLAGAAVQPGRASSDGNLPETLPAHKVVSMPGFIRLAVPAGFHAKAANTAQLSVTRIGQEANEEVRFSAVPLVRVGSLSMAVDLSDRVLMTSMAARGGYYRQRSCFFIIGQNVFEARYLVTADRIAEEGPLLDAIMRSAVFADASEDRGDEGDTTR